MYRMRKFSADDLERWASKEWQDDHGQERPVVMVGHQEYRLLSYDSKTKMAVLGFLDTGATLDILDPENTWVREPA